MRLNGKNLIFALFVLYGFLTVRSALPAQSPPTSEVAGAVIDRVLSVYGRQWANGEIRDSISEGSLTLFTLDGRKAGFEVTLLRKGNTQMQRLIKQPAGDLKQGTNGSASWESIAGMYTPTAQGRALQLIESQTSRSVSRLLNYRRESLILRDLGVHEKEQIIEAEDSQGKKTNYFIATDKDLITKLEFIIGQTRDPFTGASRSEVDTYVFSDLRLSQGILTPFQIVRYNSGSKTEEMQFKSVRYNVGLKDSDFQR